MPNFAQGLRLISFLGLLLTALVSGCSSYKQNIMFKVGDQANKNTIQQAVLTAEKAYVLKANDLVKMEVFSNKGERLIDPDGELQKHTMSNNASVPQPENQYQVSPDGSLKVPLVAPVALQGLTLREAEAVLQKEYDHFYKECFVTLTFLNKRFTVLGAGGGKVIPLTNENIKLTEALALADAMTIDSKAKAIRLLRGDEVYPIDFSTVDGYRKGNLTILPDDVIYVEPVRKPLVEGVRDFSYLGSLIVSLGTLVLVIINSSAQ